MKLKWCDRTLVVGTHYFTLCTNEKLFRKAMKHLRLPKKDWPDFVANWHSDATIHYLENKENRSVSAVICVRNFEDKTPEQITGLFVHEAMHLWREVRKAIGEREPSAEFEAYAMQNIVQELLLEFARQTK